MPLPSVSVERGNYLSLLDWSASIQRHMRPMSVVELLELGQFLFKV